MTAQPKGAISEHAVASPDRNERVSGKRAVRRLLVGLDALLIGSAWMLAGSWHPALETVAVLLWVLTATGLTLLAFLYQRLYTARVAAVAAVEVQRLGRAVATTAVLMLLGTTVIGLQLPTSFLSMGTVLSFFLAAVMRSGFRTWLCARRRQGDLRRPVLLAGNADEADHVARLLIDHPELGYDIVGFVGSGELNEMAGVTHLGSLSDAVRVAAEHRVTGVIVVGGDLRRSELNGLIRALLLTRLHVQFSAGVSGIAAGRFRPLPLAREPFYYIEAIRLAPLAIRTKRVLDLVVGSAALVVTMPLWLLVAGAILLSDGRPVLWRQERVGRGGTPFTMYKFRTMRRTAEDEQRNLISLNRRTDGPLFKIQGDPRVTRVGGLLRLTSLDELPQLLNVLRGEMSLVGPRPALASEMAKFDEDLRRRVLVAPGMTGLWQIEARDNPAFSAYRRFDLYYLENWSLGLDMAILLSTMARVPLRALAAAVTRLRGSASRSLFSS